MKPFSIFMLLLLLNSSLLFAQVAINSEGNPPDNSAMLDVQSTIKGVLIPRMTLADRDVISNPAKGLLVFCTDYDHLYINRGTPSSPDWAVASSQWMKNGTDIYYIGGKVGINEDSPTHALEVGGRIGINDIQVLYLPDQGTYNGSLFLGNGGDNLNDAFTNAGHWNTGLGKAALFSVITGYANTASGFEALFSNTEGLGNTANGHQALYFNKANSRSTAIGYHAMYYADDNETGRLTYNTAVGYEALAGGSTPSINTGGSNTALGYQALYSNTTGSYNTGSGIVALFSNTEGSANTASGNGALFSNITGNNNTVSGANAMYANTEGTGNTASGNRALSSNTTGNYNTSIGNSTNYYNQEGSNNTIIGFEAGKGSSVHNKSGNIFIGYQAGIDETGSNKLYIENSNSLSPLIGGDFNADEVYLNGKVGVGTSSPEFRLSLDDDGGIMAKGTYNSGATLSTTGAGTRMIWYPRRAAFRVGYVDGGRWDHDSIGIYSVAMGYNTKAKGVNSTAIGSNTIATGGSSTAMGSYSQATKFASTAMGSSISTGDYSTAMGHDCQASGQSSTAIGNSSLASGSYSITMGDHCQASGESSLALGSFNQAIGGYSSAMGFNTIASGYHSTAVGRYTQSTGFCSTAMGSYSQASGNFSTAMGSYSQASGNFSTAMGDSTTASYCELTIGKCNVGGGATSSWISTDPIFEIGIGTSASGSANAMTVLKNGKVGIGTATPEFKLSLDDDGGVIAKGLYNSGNALTTSGAGTRLIWYPKKAAIRAGYVDGNQWDDGMIGNYSISFGCGTKSSGTASTALGIYSEATGEHSTAMGGASIASGLLSTAMGYNTDAIGDYSTAMGFETTAEGYSSTAMGCSTDANGAYSTAIGVNTTAGSIASVAIGRFNLGGGTEASWVSTDPLFEIGIGTSTSAKANAVTVLKNGRVGIGTSSPDKLLVIKTSGTDDVFKILSDADNTLAKFRHAGNNSGALYLYDGSVNNTIMLYGGGNSFINGGNVGIGNSSPGYLLTMEASGGGYYSSSDHQWHNGSSREIKQDIRLNSMDVGEILDQVEIVNYRYKTEVSENPDAPYHIGFIAEDTPELLSGSERNGMATADCIGLLMAVVKEQQRQIVELQWEIKKLKKE